jgi:hypothetical protein
MVADGFVVEHLRRDMAVAIAEQQRAKRNTLARGPQPSSLEALGNHVFGHRVVHSRIDVFAGYLQKYIVSPLL